jgi:hypothetical protein
MASGRPIEIPITVDADGAEKGVSKVADAFEEVESSLKDVAKAGDQASESLEKDMSDAAKKIDRDLTKALDEVQDKAKATGKTVGREIKDGTDKAGAGMDELKGESASTAKEAAASFGSIEDAADAMQEVIANAFVGFGPAGMAAGIVAAAGIGLVVSSLQDNADKINENKEKVIDLARTIAENGGALRKADYIQAMEDYGYSIVDTKEWLDIFQEDAITGFEKMSQLSKDSGIDLKTAFDGAFGSSKDAEKGLELVNKKLTDLKEKKEAVYNTTGSILDPVDSNTLASLDDLKKKMEDNIKNQRIAEEMEKARRAAIEGTVEATLEDIAALEKKNGLLQDGVTSELDYRDQVAQTTEILEANGATLDINTQAGRDNQRALIDQSDAALSMATSQLQAGTSADVVTANLAAQREGLLLQLDAMTGSRAESERLAASMGLIPKEVITEVSTNGVAKTKTDIETIPASKDTAVNVDDEGTTDVVQKRIDTIKGRDMVKVDVDDDYTVSEVQKRIDGIKGTDVKISVSISNLGDIQRTLDNLTAQRSVDLVINERKGTSQAP